MKKWIITLITGLFFSAFSFSQGYQTSIGLRGGIFSGITVKHFITETNAIEGILATRYNGGALIGLYEFNNSTSTANLSWFYGFGGHVGSYSRLSYYENGHQYYYDGNFMTVGVDGILGLEYVFEEIPLNLSIDVKPYIELINGNTNFFDVALSARYCF